MNYNFDFYLIINLSKTFTTVMNTALISIRGKDPS